MEGFVGVAEYAQRLGIGVERVRQLCKTGRIPGAHLVQVGRASLWLIPEAAQDPRNRAGRPKKEAPAEPILPPSTAPKIRRVPIDQVAARRRLAAGRKEAQRIIDAMKLIGVTVELFGSMRTGKVFPTSDIDLLVTDSGPMSPERAIYEIQRLAEGDIPVDVTILEYVPAHSLARVMESLHG
jgi:predicted nucleotidyltransferase